MELTGDNVLQQASRQLLNPRELSKPELNITVPEDPFTALQTDRPVENGTETVVRQYATQDEPFNLLDAFLGHDELLFYLTGTMLPPRDFFNLYSASRAFFIKVNLQKTSYILSVARNWAHITDPCPSAPLSIDVPSRFLTFEQKNLSSFAGTPKAPHLVPYELYRKNRFLYGEKPRWNPDGSSRKHPDFGYLRFLHDETTAAEKVVVALWHRFGLRLPAYSMRTMVKLALVMHARRNNLRVILLANESWFTDADLFRAETLFTRLEMAFGDALHNSQARVGPGNLHHYTGSGARSFRQLICAQYGWTECARKLSGHPEELSVNKIMRLLVQYASVGHFAGGYGHRLYGVDYDAVGILSTEEVLGEYGERVKSRLILVNIEDLISRESGRRDLSLDRFVIEMMTCGFNDPVTKQVLPGPPAPSDT